MTGTIVNVALILFGGLFFHFRKRELSVENQQLTRLIIVALVLYSGFRMLWSGLSGGPLHEIGQLGIVFVAMSLGRIVGSLLKIQSGLNRMLALRARSPRIPSTGIAPLLDPLCPCACEVTARCSGSGGWLLRVLRLLAAFARVSPVTPVRFYPGSSECSS